MTEHEDLIYRGRPVSSRLPMERSRRAKQFAPFDALKGFAEAIHAKELQAEEETNWSYKKYEN